VSAALREGRSKQPQADVLAVDGLSNFRDWGGHATASGGRILSGRLYRSAHLAGLTPNGLGQLTFLGVGRVVDLRGAGERQGAMAAIPDGLIEIRSTPVEPRTTDSLRRMLASGTADYGRLRDLMIESYRAYVAEAAEIFGEAVYAVATAGDRAVLIHCTAGKDRTGFLVALLQKALGAGEEAVLADYLRTNADWDRASVAGRLPLQDAAIQAILLADADYLSAAFEEIERRDGGIDAFIHRATGGRVGAEQLAHLVEMEGRP
jgi:protein-tyrosine phosphatase